jgi:hypothetical protein
VARCWDFQEARDSCISAINLGCGSNGGTKIKGTYYYWDTKAGPDIKGNILSGEVTSL